MNSRDIQGSHNNYQRGQLVQAAATYMLAFEHRQTDRTTYTINRDEFLRQAGNLVQKWDFGEVPDDSLYQFARLIYFAAEGFVPCHE